MIRLELRELLEEKTGTLLLIAGGFLLFQLLIQALPDFVGFTVPARLPDWAGFIFSGALPGLVGFAIPFVALFGLYHRLTSETPRLAAVGVALMALTPILFVSGLLTMLVRPVPRVPSLLWLSPLPYTLGAGSFGLAFLRKNGPGRRIGVPLLVFSGTLILQYTVSLKNGRPPEWLPFVGLLAVSQITMGYLLYRTPTTRNDGTLASG